MQYPVHLSDDQFGTSPNCSAGGKPVIQHQIEGSAPDLAPDEQEFRSNALERG